MITIDWYYQHEKLLVFIYDFGLVQEVILVSHKLYNNGMII